MPDGSEKPVAYASRTLSKAVQNYSQVEKEGLACIFGVKKYHSYLHGRKFELVTDHKPLQSLFNEAKSTPPQATSIIQRWALMLANYEYNLKFRHTSERGNADAFSRLPLKDNNTQVPMSADTILLLENLNQGPITTTEISNWTAKDPVLSRALNFERTGWPNECPSSSNDFKPYFQRRNELSVEDGCLLWGNRVIVPKQGRTQILNELHGSHPGIARMKSLARMLVW
ncbi:hypothetical protein BSL78_16969 [Apostichopus japonicus]|uniref:Reverse transcriptase RNase H-like domain-containing protein n=1 Tax=Stichopus japonicus TaxID=307972 RepID=A0A2G8KDU7_STIJA|nr:hypothetical protein BSL78_16969 [Apostichopus japonicus]